jgi:hypothetical protein
MRQHAMPGRCARQRLHDLGLLATTHSSARTTPRPRVGTRALATRRHAAPMPQTAIAPNVHQALNVHRDFATQVTLDPHLFVDDFSNPVHFVVREIPDARVRVHVRALEELLAGMKPDAEDVGQRRLDSLIARKIDPCNSRHVASPLGPPTRERLTLPLLVPRIDADHPNDTFAADDFALLTTASY